MKLNEVREKYLDFFGNHDHKEVQSSSLVPENDPTTLFTSSGMQPLIPYLLGEKHPSGKRIVNSQKCFRLGDIDEVGDNRHTTFFEMLGNWSLGDYFKKEQIPWVFEFLTSSLGIDPSRIFVTAFIGDNDLGIPKDTESAEIWKGIFLKKGIVAKEVELGSEENGNKVGMQDGRIFYFDSKKNWWSRSGTPDKMPSGEPGGPDTEIFYDSGAEHDLRFGAHCHPNCDCGKFVEIGNSVFMEYIKKPEDGFDKLYQQNVDFGGGLERIVAATLGTSDIFKIDVLNSAIVSLENDSGKSYDEPQFTRSFRIVTDHMRAVTFLLADGVIPSNTDQGYFVRRLIRRSVRHMDLLGIKEGSMASLVPVFVNYYKKQYPEISANSNLVLQTINEEEQKFRKTLEKGMKEFEKISHADITGKDAFLLFSTYGFPIDMTVDLAIEKGIKVDKVAFEEEFESHQALSRKGAEKKFKGGLADTSEISVKYHTATHLLNAALRQVLGEQVSQKGSNITSERLRFDFSHNEKMTDEQKRQVEEIVNQKIKESLPVTYCEIPIDEAKRKGAIGVFNDKYSDIVKVYSVGDEKTGIFSMELCGGPHVTNTETLGTFKIKKEEAVAGGIRRIKAVLE